MDRFTLIPYLEHYADCDFRRCQADPQRKRVEVIMSACAISITNEIVPGEAIDPDPASDLVDRARAGDQAAFSKLFEAHKKRVYSLCLRMTGDVSEAEDLTQEAFLQVFRKLGTFRGDSALSTWLYRVAFNTVLMKLRKRKPREVSLDEPICTESFEVKREYGRADLILQGTVDRLALIRAIDDLPAGYRIIFILHEIEGYQHHEIAELLDCSSGNTKSQLHKARMKIREHLLSDRKPSDKKPVRRKPRRDLTKLLSRWSKPAKQEVFSPAIARSMSKEPNSAEAPAGT